MWSALENIALRESLPAPLEPGDSVHDILVSGQLPSGRYNLHHLGRRRSKPYLLKQFYSIDTNAFLRWQNEARFISLSPTEGFAWPCEEWKGGLITPLPDGSPLREWLEDAPHSLEKRLCVAARLACRLAALHASGIAHRGLSPANILIGEYGLTVTDFGHSHCAEWDDFWTDTVRSPAEETCSPPEALCGESGGCKEDVYAFGTLLHLLISGKPAFGPLKRWLRPLLPGHIPANRLSAHSQMPSMIRELETACLEPVPANRADMDEVLATLSDYGDQPQATGTRIEIPTVTSGSESKKKVMVFLDDRDLMDAQFDSVLATAERAPSIFLFVGLIPNNLPSGHLERFKGSMFRKLGSTLPKCRAHGLEWGLRIFENVDPQKAKEALLAQYAPDIHC